MWSVLGGGEGVGGGLQRLGRGWAAAAAAANMEISVAETQQSPSQAVESESGEIHSSSKDVFLQVSKVPRE